MSASTQSVLSHLNRYIRARYPLVVVLSHEESRVLSAVQAVAQDRKRDLYVWSITRGLRLCDPSAQPAPPFDPEATRDPLPACQALLDYSDALDKDGYPLYPPALFVFEDLHPYLQDPIVVRSLRDVAANFELHSHNLVLLSPQLTLPPDLEKTAAVLDWPLPDVEDLDAILDQCERDLPERFPVDLNGSRQAILQALAGLTAFEAANALSSAIIATRSLSHEIIPHIIREKRQIIRKNGLLEFYDAEVTMDQVGGLHNLKEYARVKRSTFAEEARDFGVEPAKGVLLVGIPGTGKSLSAKAVAGGYLPLLRMDVGALFGGLVGQSEANMRSALKVAEAIAPCVLWIDEIEKALGSSGTEHDGGTSARVFGTLLTWMQETPAPVYVIATANDVRSLRPELLRRFDDLVFVDLPCHADREEIIGLHLARRGRDYQKFDLSRVAAATWGFTGAEIEKAVRSAIEESFVYDTELTTESLLVAADRIIPISTSMADTIKELREWSKGKALLAGDPLEPEPSRQASASSRRRVDL